MSKSVERPALWIVAGPNGSGKSSLYTGVNIEGFSESVWIINPDILAAQIFHRERLDRRAANLEAVKRIYAWLEASVATYKTIGVETVLSTGKYRSLVTAAKVNGFEIRLIYVLLKTVGLNVERVKLRVAKGGHSVPKNKIIERRAKSLAQLPWFLDAADQAWIFDNSGKEPQLIAAKLDGAVTVDPSALPEIKTAADSLPSFRSSKQIPK